MRAAALSEMLGRSREEVSHLCDLGWDQWPSEGHEEQSSMEEIEPQQLSMELGVQPEDTWVLGPGFRVLGQWLPILQPTG